jgi:hypothetical protein
MVLDLAGAPDQEEVEGNQEDDHPRLTIVDRGLFYLRVSARSGCWVATSAVLTERFGRGDRLGRDRLLVTEDVDNTLREYLEALFLAVVAGPAASFLAHDELRAVLTSPHRRDLALGVLVSSARQAVIIVRGDLERTVVPWSWFRPTPRGVSPDFADAQIIDSGLTIRLGQFEAAMDAILYEFDRVYRARARQRRLDGDPSFGAALRRLRLQKGVARGEFPGISQKEIARIERGEVVRPRGATLRAIAHKLGVEPGDIDTY